MGDIQQNRCGSAVVLAAFAGAAAAGFSCYAYSRWQKAQSHHNRSLKTVTTPASHDAPSDFPQELSDALQLHYGGDAMKELLNEMGLVRCWQPCTASMLHIEQRAIAALSTICQHASASVHSTIMNSHAQVFGSEFAADCAQICERNCDALQDFTGALPIASRDPGLPAYAAVSVIRGGACRREGGGHSTGPGLLRGRHQL